MHLALIQAHWQAREFEKALQVLDKALAAEPENSHFWILRGDVIQLQDTPSGPSLLEAEQCYLNAIKLNPDYLEGLESLAHFYDAVLVKPIQAKIYAKNILC